MKIQGAENIGDATIDQSIADINGLGTSAVPSKEYVDSVAGSTHSGDSASRPSSPETGYPYFNTTLGYQTWYNGTEWVNATGGYELPNL